MADKPTASSEAEWHPEEIRDVAERWALERGDASPDDPFRFLLGRVAMKVRGWLENDRRTLMQTLYRLDVSEAKVQTVLRGSGDFASQAMEIAKLILRRELQKARTRRQSSPPPS